MARNKTPSKKNAMKPAEGSKDADGGSKSSSKPVVHLKKSLKPSVAANKLTKDMVLRAFEGENKDERVGVSLATIRNYIRKTYNNGKKLGKAYQERVKELIKEEFRKAWLLKTNLLQLIRKVQVFFRLDQIDANG
ncbi:hypothetical protein Bhyg_01888 [Pseudolycoriella hygida]|uniref:H15 domain-containing protein n=1 Tax=Pseudolycoriella hygida TaxID=35572 RepID=A0A9Q0S815_9DIPT|nr:hypothetical protein Bhyg_01888 [Pseudolycoriella hygida]